MQVWGIHRNVWSEQISSYHQIHCCQGLNQPKCFKLQNWDILLPISEMIVIALSRLTLGIVIWKADHIFIIRIRINHRVYFSVYIIDFSCDAIRMCTYEVHTIFFGISHLISFNGFDNSIFFRFVRPKKLWSYFLMIDRINRLYKQIVNNGCRWFPEDIKYN